MAKKTKKQRMNIRVDQEDYDHIRAMAGDLGCSVSEVWRKLFTSVKVLYDGDLKLGDLLDPDKAGVLSSDVREMVRWFDEEAKLELQRLTRPVDELMKILEARRTLRAVNSHKGLGTEAS